MDVTVVEQVRPEITYRLRQEVLRPGLAPEKSAFPGDRQPATGHFAAYDGGPGSGMGGEAAAGVTGVTGVVGVASVFAEPEPQNGPGRWRLRGMAVDPAYRGQGVGAALLERVRDFVARSGGGTIWCNARLTAEGFYRGAGFVRVSEVWEEPDIGPHVRMRG